MSQTFFVSDERMVEFLKDLHASYEQREFEWGLEPPKVPKIRIRRSTLSTGGFMVELAEKDYNRLVDKLVKVNIKDLYSGNTPLTPVPE